MSLAAWNRAWADLKRERLGATGTFKTGDPDPLPDIQPVVSVAPAGAYWQELANIATQQGGSLLLAAGKAANARLDGVTLLQHDMPCDVAVVRAARRAPRATAWDEQQRPQILLPARGGPHASLALRIAGALVASRGAELALLHVLQQDLPERQRTREERPFAALLGQAGLPKETRQVWAVSRSVVDAILQEADGYDLLMLGAPVGTGGADGQLGRITSAILNRAEVAVIVVKTAVAAAPAIEALLKGRGESRDLTPEALSLVVDKWFAENTFNSEEYANLRQLLEIKQQRGVTISLGLPTLNEEATIGEIITVLKTALMDEVPLLDEIVVIDSESTDRTVEIARGLGVPVHVHQELLPEAGPALRGKGEALWKSLHVLKGDIVAWVDTGCGQHAPPLRLRPDRPPADRAAHRLRQGLLSPADQGRRHPATRGRGPRDGTHGAAAV